MGVRGLKTFIENNDDLLVSDYRLHNTCVIIDAYNLIGDLLRRTQKYKRCKLSNEDLTKYSICVKSFFNNFSRCNIRPILVFDGQSEAINSGVTADQASDKNSVDIIKTRYGILHPPVAASNTFKSIAAEKGIHIVQCLKEADIEIVQYSRALRCPVISNDSDFYLMYLPNGLIPIDLIKYQHVHFSEYSSSENQNKLKCEPKYQYISCSIFYQDHFLQHFPNLDKNTLPLLGILAGNDFIQSKVIRRICSQLPLALICERHGISTKQFRRMNNKQQEKITKILYYMCDKTLEETLNNICSHVRKQDRRDLKELIRSYMKFYTIPYEDESEIELRLRQTIASQ